MRELFKNPEDIYRGTDFWMLNDTLHEEELVMQMQEMKDKGVCSFVARTFVGLRANYPKADFMEKMHFIVDNAKRLGLKVFVQAKYMPECVPELPLRHCVSHIIPKPDFEVKAEDKVLCVYEGVCFVEQTAEKILNLFDAEAVKYYIKENYEDMWADFGDEFGKTISSIWVDEPCFTRKYTAWSKSIKEAFQEKWGYDLTSQIYKLYYDVEDYKTVRYHFWTLLQGLMEKNYYAVLRKWCTNNNVLFSGHLMGEESLKSINIACSFMPYYKYFDIPGIDMLTAYMNWSDEPITQKYEDITADYQKRYMPVMQLMSAVRQAGNDKRVLCEMYGASTQNMTFRNQMNMFDHFAAFGINHRSVHAIIYSLAGRRKRAYPPHINYYQPYWYKYKNVTDYCARVSHFISLGNPTEDILILHPQETAYMLCRGKGDCFNAQDYLLDKYDTEFFYTVLALKSAKCNFDFGDFLTLRDMGKVTEEGKLQVGKMKYKTVVLPKLEVLSKSVLKLLKDFNKAGGKILCYGNAPHMLDGVEYDISGELELVYVDTVPELVKILKEDSDFIISDDVHVTVNHRKDKGTDYFMLFNTDCSSKKKLNMRVSGERQVIEWNAQNGECKEIFSGFDGEYTKLDITLNEGDSLLLSFEKGKKCTLLPTEKKGHISIPLDGQWNIKREKENVFMLEYCRYRKDGDFSPELPVLAVNDILTNEEYYGPLELEFGFSSEITPKNMKLMIEYPEICEIFLNGVKVQNNVSGYFWAKEFKTVKLPDVIRKGDNKLTLKLDFSPLKNVSSSLTNLFCDTEGVELENMCLIGDFGVEAFKEHTLNRNLKYNRHFTMISENKKAVSDCEFTANGYPFYAGTLMISKNVSIKKYEKVVFEVDYFNGAVGELYVNGKWCADINKASCKVDCTEFIHEGENEIILRITNTLKNLLGPWHRPSGERGNAFTDTPSRSKGAYSYFNEPWVPMDMTDENWINVIDVEHKLWTPSYFMSPFGMKGVRLKVTE